MGQMARLKSLMATGAESSNHNMKHEESIIQAAIVSALSLAGVYVLMIPNDAAGNTSMAKAGRMKAMGLRAGVSDLVVMHPDGRAHFLEVKTATGVLSPAQIRFAELCIKRGWKYEVARTVEQSLDICRKWGIL
jgi:hypothetical protein